jgi:hypothetical protein
MRVGLARGERIFAPGVARVLARCWPMPPPTPTSPPMVRLDLAFQALPDEASAPGPAFEPPVVRPEEERGELLHDLTVRIVGEPGFAYLLTCEEPSVAWGAAAGPPPPMETGFSPPPEEDAPPTSPITPGATRSFGEAALAAEPKDGAGPRHRAIIAIVPRPPARYRLLP